MSEAIMLNHGTGPEAVDEQGTPILVEVRSETATGDRASLEALADGLRDCECGTEFLSLDALAAPEVQELIAELTAYMEANLTCPFEGGVALLIQALNDKDVGTFLDKADDCTWAASTSLSASGLTFSGAMDFGAQVSWVPDVDGDGIREIAVSNHKFGLTASSDAGGVFLFMSPHDTPLNEFTSDGWYLGVGSPDEAGTAMFGSRDLTADGNPDLVIGAPFADTNDGRVYVARAGAVFVDLVSQSNIVEIRNVPGNG